MNDDFDSDMLGFAVSVVGMAICVMGALLMEWLA